MAKRAREDAADDAMDELFRAYERAFARRDTFAGIYNRFANIYPRTDEIEKILGPLSINFWESEKECMDLDGGRMQLEAGTHQPADVLATYRLVHSSEQNARDEDAVNVWLRDRRVVESELSTCYANTAEAFRTFTTHVWQYGAAHPTTVMWETVHAAYEKQANIAKETLLTDGPVFEYWAQYPLHPQAHILPDRVAYRGNWATSVRYGQVAAPAVAVPADDDNEVNVMDGAGGGGEPWSSGEFDDLADVLQQIGAQPPPPPPPPKKAAGRPPGTGLANAWTAAHNATQLIKTEMDAKAKYRNFVVDDSYEAEISTRETYRRLLIAYNEAMRREQEAKDAFEEAQEEAERNGGRFAKTPTFINAFSMVGNQAETPPPKKPQRRPPPRERERSASPPPRRGRGPRERERSASPPPRRGRGRGAPTRQPPPGGYARRVSGQSILRGNRVPAPFRPTRLAPPEEEEEERPLHRGLAKSPHTSHQAMSRQGPEEEEEDVLPPAPGGYYSPERPIFPGVAPRAASPLLDREEEEEENEAIFYQLSYRNSPSAIPPLAPRPRTPPLLAPERPIFTGVAPRAASPLIDREEEEEAPRNSPSAIPPLAPRPRTPSPPPPLLAPAPPIDHEKNAEAESWSSDPDEIRWY